MAAHPSRPNLRRQGENEDVSDVAVMVTGAVLTPSLFGAIKRDAAADILGTVARYLFRGITEQ